MKETMGAAKSERSRGFGFEGMKVHGAALQKQPVSEAVLVSSKEVVRELRSLLESSRVKAPKKPAGAPAMAGFDELSRLESVKRERNKVKMEMALAAEATAEAERAADAALLRSATSLGSIEDLRKEVDDLNAEHVLVEIARLDAVAETKEIEAKRAAEAAVFDDKIKGLRDRMKTTTKEIDKSKDRQREEMAMATARIEQEQLQKELEAVKQELAATKDEGFRLMTSMDLARRELMQISTETGRLKKIEERQDLVLQNLNSKLLRARSKLEAAAASAKKSSSIVLNLLTALRQLRADVEAMKMEKDRAEEEIRSANERIQSTESELDSADQRLEDAIESLRIAKGSEAAALAKLKHLSERTMKFRACAAPRSSTITMSAFEYEYLKGQAEEAQKIAEKKADAARAWIDAFKASEEEIQLKIDRARREMAEIEAKESKESNEEDKAENLDRQTEVDADRQLVTARRKSIKESGNAAALRRSKSRARRSSLTHGQRPFPQSPSVVLKRKKVMPGLVKFLRRGRKPGASPRDQESFP